MQDRRIIVVGAVIAVVLGLLLANYVGLFGEDYGTGLSINTSTQKFEFYGNYKIDGKKFLYTQDYEMLDEVYIASWQPQGKSTTFSAIAKFRFNSYYTVLDPMVLLGQYYWVVQYMDTNRQLHTIINGKNNYVDTNYVVDLKGSIIGNIPNVIYKSPYYIDGTPPNVFGDNTWTWFEDNSWHSLQTGTITFKIKGNHIGAVRVFCVLECSEEVPAWTPTWSSADYLIVEDWAYLAPGIGRVDVLSTNSIRQDGTTYTEGTNREVPLYVFEEGSTVKFTVDTGYAGAVTGEKGWRLAVYKSDQTSPLATWWLDDDLRGYIVTWTIPKGTFTPGGDNRMRVVLTNTIIDQAETTFFVVDNISKIPGTPEIFVDKYEYNQGEKVEVTLRAKANPDGTGEISQFYVEVKWDRTDGTEYILEKYIDAHHIEGLTYGASFSFTPDRPDRHCYILAWSIDRDGRASGRAVREIYVQETYGNLRLTVLVKEPSGGAIVGAKITIGGQTKYTTADGAVFYLPSGTYSITVEKAGYNTYKGQVYMNADKTIEITLTPLILPPEGWAIYLLIAVAILVMIYIGVVIYKKYSHR